jgi:hypothetical protein
MDCPIQPTKQKRDPALLVLSNGNTLTPAAQTAPSG